MESPEAIKPQVLSTWSAAFFTKLHRYKNLLRRRWWVLAIMVSLGLLWQGYKVATAPAVYISQARMMVSPRIAMQENASYSEELSNFFGTQIELMQSGEVGNRAVARIKATKPDLPVGAANLSVFQSPKTSIFELTAAGSEPKYVQAYLDAVLEEFIRFKDEMRVDTSEKTLSAITEQLLRLEKELEKSQQELFEFQKENDVVLLKEQGNTAGQYLLNLEKEQADINKELQLLNLLKDAKEVDSKEGGDSKAVDTAVLVAQGPEDEYAQATKQLQMLRTELEELSANLKPKHPKILKLRDEIARQETLINIYRSQGLKELESRRETLLLKKDNLDKLIKEWSAKALKSTQLLAEYSRLEANVDRTKNLYDRLLDTVQSLDVSSNINQTTIQILERATPAVSVKTGVLKSLLMGIIIGLGLGVGILFLLDRIDDRINSFSELKEYFDEQVLGQIPKEMIAGASRLPLLSPNDTRQVYSEAFRNIRSSLLYMAMQGERPKMLGITSAIPGEGKSTIASNLAITMAFAGSRVLLVDADLRKGVLHQDFEFSTSPGLADVLAQECHWSQVAKDVPQVKNLQFIPRGRPGAHIGELLLGPTMELLLKETKELYDYVVIDTPPVLAADDTTSLAPKLDGVMVVMRSSYTSSRMTQSALDALYQRQVNVLGMIFNCIDTRLPDYYHYQYYRSYYHEPEA